jgi:reverse transcriptase-like protein
LRQFHRQHHRTRKRADFLLVLPTRELGKSAYEAKQMTTARAVGAASSEAEEWYAIDRPTIHRAVRRLQVRIVQATKASRWGKVQILQRLLIPRNRVSPKEAFEGLELCERKLSCTVLRGLDGSNPVRYSVTRQQVQRVSRNR